MAIRFEAATPPTSPVRKVENATPQAPAEQTLGQQTLGMVLKKASESARAFGDSLTARLDEARKASAREQVAEVRERIKMLKRLILLFGSSKALVRELKQLAGQLAAAADVLKDSGENSTASSGLSMGTLYTESGRFAEQGFAPEEAAEEAARVEDEARAGQAESERAAATASETNFRGEQSERARAERPVFVISSDPQQAQRSADAEELEKALRELKALYASAKASRRKRDREEQKDLKEAGEYLAQVGESIGELREPASLRVSVKV